MKELGMVRVKSFDGSVYVVVRYCFVGNMLNFFNDNVVLKVRWVKIYFLRVIWDCGKIGSENSLIVNFE